MSHVTNSQITGYANRGESAQTSTGNFWTVPGFTGNSGHMPNNLYHVLRALNSLDFGHNIDQTIYSYGTPIAVLVRGVWIRPDVTYSITTSSKHESQLYWLNGRTEFVPWDISLPELIRVIEGEMRYVRPLTRHGIGSFVAGPNYTPSDD